MISVLQWFWAAASNEKIITPFPSVISQDRRAVEQARRLTLDTLCSSQFQPAPKSSGREQQSTSDSELKHTLLEINNNLRNQHEVKEIEDIGRKPAWFKFPEITQRTILPMSSKDGTLESAPSDPAQSFLEFTAAVSTANAHMMFSHMLKKEKCRAFPSKGMVTALYGGNLLALDDTQGLGFTVFGLPSSSQTESSGEEDLLKNQINATDG